MITGGPWCPKASLFLIYVTAVNRRWRLVLWLILSEEKIALGKHGAVSYRLLLAQMPGGASESVCWELAPAASAMTSKYRSVRQKHLES